MSHECHAHGCSRQIPPSMFMCGLHWFRIRKPVRDAIWKEYSPGQENTKTPSFRYLAVQQRAIGELVFEPNSEQAAHTASRYLIASEIYRTRAIEDGLGDPLKGLTDNPPQARP